MLPSERLRKLEIEVNAAFESYRDMFVFVKGTFCVFLFKFRYFGGGVSSVYFWDIENGFAGVVLIKKETDGVKAVKGCWDSIHVLEVNEKSMKVKKVLIIKLSEKCFV